MTKKDYERKLALCTSQQDVDNIVRSAASALPAKDFGRLLIKVKKRRAALPPRYL